MITILRNPSGTPSIQDNLWHVATSDNSGQTGFKYVFDIFKGTQQLIRVKQFPEPGTGRGYFDASPIIRNEITYAWFTPGDTVYLKQPSQSGEIAQGYTIRVGEDFSGITTTNLASANVSAYNWRPPVFGRRVSDLSSRLNGYMSSRPRSLRASLTDNVMIGVYTNATLTVKVDTYDYGSQLIASNVDVSGYANSGFVQCNIGATAINNRFGTTVIGSNVRFYDVWFNSFDKIRVHIECNGNYQPITLHFLNRWGMFDSAKFGLVSRLNMNAERKEFKQRDYRFTSDNVTYYDANNVYHDSNVNYLNQFDHTYKLTMDAPTDAEYEWLADLIVSPQVYAEINGAYYPVSMRTNSYEYSKYVNNRLRALEIEIDVNQSRQSHLR